MLEPLLVLALQLDVVSQELEAAQQQLAEIEDGRRGARPLVALVEVDHLAPARVAFVAQILRPKTLVLLRVDEPLDLFRYPNVLVELERAQHAADHAVLVLGIHDLEAFGEAGFAPVDPKQAMRQAVERADPEIARRHAEQRLDAIAHLGRRLVRERDGEHVLRRYAVDADDPRNSVHEHARLAAAGAGQHERRAVRRRDGLALRVVQRIDDVGDVHRVAKRRAFRSGTVCSSQAGQTAGM